MIALSVTGSIDLSSTLVFSGLANIITGVVFGVPLPVQPMKAIAAVAISQKFTKDETAAAGLVVSFAVLALSVTGLLHWVSLITYHLLHLTTCNHFTYMPLLTPCILHSAFPRTNVNRKVYRSIPYILYILAHRIYFRTLSYTTGNF